MAGHRGGVVLLLLAIMLFFEVNGMTRPFQRHLMKQNKEVIAKNETLWFTQKLDHFDPDNSATWQQKYTINDTFFTSNDGPIFIFLSGEAPMEFFWFQEVQAINWAKEHSALYISIEHRYYGDSNPTSDYSTKYLLKYLRSQQALADAAYFIESFKNDNPTYTGKWVVFGCSYSGALSAWFRTLYPELVVASVAPSGPVQALLDFSAYFGQFSHSATPDCVNAAATATKQITQMMESQTGRATLARYFNSCQPTIPEEDSYFFLYSIAGLLGSADQMSNPPDWTLNSTCNQLLEGGTFVQNWGQIFIQQNGDSPNCTDFSESDFIASMQDPSIDAQQSGNRAWTFQTCAEFGYFSTSYPGTSVFFPTLDVEHQVKWCAQIFGVPGMTPNIDFTNGFYGGYAVRGTNIMFTNGLLDPWHLLSVNEDFPDGSVLAATYEAGHCASMIAATSIDPPSLTAARQRVSTFLATVLE